MNLFAGLARTHKVRVLEIALRYTKDETARQRLLALLEIEREAQRRFREKVRAVNSRACK